MMKSNNKNTRTVILDLGNVVLNWNVDGILDSLGLEIDVQDLLRSELFLHQDWLDMDHGKVTEAEVMAAVCARSPLQTDQVERALLAAKQSLIPIAESVLLMREISEAGLKMYCLSNMSRETYDHIKGLALFDMFDGIIISGIEGMMKPNEDIFQLIISRYGLKPADTIFVDDSKPNIDTAEHLGILGVHFLRSQECYAGLRELILDR